MKYLKIYQGNVVPVPKHYAIKMYREVEVKLHTLTVALDGIERLALCSGQFIPREKSPQYSLERRLDGSHSWSDLEVLIVIINLNITKIIEEILCTLKISQVQPHFSSYSPMWENSYSTTKLKSSLASGQK
jgi:hypothetical protein